MAKKAGSRAYEYYLQTGHIAGQYEGAWVRGNGTAPENPMGLDLFLEKSRSIPPVKANTEGDPWSTELVVKVMWSNPKITDKSIDEGWILGLFDFIRDKHRLPKNHEFDKLRRAAKYVRECAAGRENITKDQRELAQILMDKRAKLSAEFAR